MGILGEVLIIYAFLDFVLHRGCCQDRFLRRADARTRLELDARNSPDVRPPTVFELLADKWNDSAFNPVAAVSDCHEDFS